MEEHLTRSASRLQGSGLSHGQETEAVPERSYRWKRNKQLIFLGAYLLILVAAIWLLTQQYPTAWLLVIVAALGSLQPIVILRSLRRTSDQDGSGSG